MNSFMRASIYPNLDAIPTFVPNVGIFACIIPKEVLKMGIWSKS